MNKQIEPEPEPKLSYYWCGNCGTMFPINPDKKTELKSGSECPVCGVSRLKKFQQIG